MARILLIKCAQNVGMRSPSVFPLGIMSLAAVLRKDDDRHIIQVYDMRLKGDDPVRLQQVVRHFNPTMVGFSAISMESKNLYSSAGAVRETGFDGPIIAGGPHPTSFPEETLACKAIDYVAFGEGEETIKHLVRSFDAGKDLTAVHGIGYRKNRIVHSSPPQQMVPNLNELPFPAYDLVDIEEYSGHQSMSPFRTGRFMNLFTSRACPFKCIYCHSFFGKKFRAVSAERVVEHIKLLHENYKINCLEIIDDIFNWDLNRAKKILDLMVLEGLRPEISFAGGLRSDRLDREFLTKLSRFKSPQIGVAVETASPRLQSLINKRLNLEKVTQTINTCNELGIYTRGFFMLGFPTETEKELKATLKYAFKSKLHAAFFFIVTPFKGTELYNLCAHKLHGKDANMLDNNFFHSPVNISDIPDAVLFNAQKWANVKFALNPNRIYRVLRDAPNQKFLWQGIKCRWEFITKSGMGFKQ